MQNPAVDPVPPNPEMAAYEMVFTDAHVAALWQRLRRLRRGRVFVRVFRWLAGALLLGLLGLVLWLDLKQWWLALALLAFFLVVVFSERLDRSMVVRRWRGSPHRDQRSRMELSPTGLRSTSALSEGSSRWASFTSARRFPDGFLLFSGPRLAYWLPDHALVEGTTDQAARLIFGGVPDYKEV